MPERELHPPLCGGEAKREQLLSFAGHDQCDWMQNQDVIHVATPEQDLELIQESERAVRQLQADILDVPQLSQDLALMIRAQGDPTDSSEANVESSEQRYVQRELHWSDSAPKLLRIRKENLARTSVY